MDLQNMDLNGGTLQISTEVIGKIARCAALEVDGVSEVSCGKQNKKVKELLAAASIQPPVTVEMRDGTAELTLNLVEICRLPPLRSIFCKSILWSSI